MSVRFDSTTDYLRAIGITTLTIGTGAFSVGKWFKLVNDTNAYADLVMLSEAVGDDSPHIGAYTDSNGTSLKGAFGLAGGYDVGSLSITTWYWLVVSRTDTTFRVRTFDDTTSTTPVLNVTQTSESTDYATLDCVLLGYNGFGDDSADMEVENLKIHTGVAWSDAQCRTESQNYGIQTAGGTDRYCWKLTDVDADTNGINEIGGAGPNLTNSGCVAGASTPAQLTPAGAWGFQLGMQLHRLVRV
jgi:hypothetical protein